MPSALFSSGPAWSYEPAVKKTQKNFNHIHNDICFASINQPKKNVQLCEVSTVPADDLALSGLQAVMITWPSIH